MHAAGGGRRHRDNVIAAIAAAHRRALDRAIGFQVVERHAAAGVAHRFHDAFGDRPFVEAARALPRNRFQRIGQIGLDQFVAGGQNGVALEKDFHR